MLEPQKLRKLQEYVTILTDQGQSAESEGRNEDAVKAYIKLVDVLLLLARESEDHSTWSQYTKQAESYQNRVKSLIPADQQIGFHQAPPPPSLPKAEPKQAFTPNPRPNAIPQSHPPPIDQGASRVGSLRKILKPFQKVEDAPVQKSIPAPGQQALSYSQNLTQPAERANPTAKSPKPTELELVVSTYQKKLDAAMTEIRSIKEQLVAAQNERENLTTYYEGQIRELNERLVNSVPRADYDELQLQLSEMITKAEYERLKAEVADRVPRQEYDELLSRVMNSVPRDLYLAAEVKATKLEEGLREMVPRKILDEIATEITMLTMLAKIPIGDSEKETSHHPSGP